MLNWSSIAWVRLKNSLCTVRNDKVCCSADRILNLPQFLLGKGKEKPKVLIPC